MAPTGGGKTLAGFLPSLIDLAGRAQARAGQRAAHALYLAAQGAGGGCGAQSGNAHRGDGPAGDGGDPHRRYAAPRGASASAMPRPISCSPRRSNWRCCWPIRAAAQLFEGLQAPWCWTNCMRSTIPSAAIFWRWVWRGLRTLAPDHRRVGLSATVADPAPLQRFLCRSRWTARALAELVIAAQAGAKPRDRDQRLGFLCALGGPSGAPCHGRCDGGDPRRPRPRWSSSTPAARPSAPSRNCGASTTTICPSRCITARWRRSSAARWKRRWRKGDLRAVVCTSTLDLGIDWGAVDKVICIGAPKGAARLVQRIGRANHRLDEPSARVAGAGQPLRSAGMQCRARCGAGGRTGRRAAEARRPGCAGPACAGHGVAAPFDADALYAEVRRAVALSRI